MLSDESTVVHPSAFGDSVKFVTIWYCNLYSELLVIFKLAFLSDHVGSDIVKSVAILPVSTVTILLVVFPNLSATSTFI